MSDPRSPQNFDGGRGPGDANVVDLLGRLTSQGAHLAQEQIALIQAEMRDGVAGIRTAIAAYASAAIAGLAGLGVTLTGLGWLAGDALDNVPLGIVMVGAGTLLIAAILYAGARKKIRQSSLRPERTLRTLEDTPEIVTGAHTTTPKEASYDRT